MSEAATPGDPQRTAEENLAIGCLGLLCLQQLHEGFYFCLDRTGPGLQSMHSAWFILLLLFVGLATGLWNQRRAAWWLALAVVGVIGVLHIGGTLAFLYPRIEPPSPGIIRCGWRPPVDRFRGAWLVATSALLLAVPLFLLLGRLRERLRLTP